jgi:hypothetical protein
MNLTSLKWVYHCIIRLNSLFDENKSRVLKDLFLKVINDVPEFGDYARETIESEYLPNIYNYINNKDNPLKIVCDILHYKISNNNESKLDIFSNFTLSAVIAPYLGKWKVLNDNYKIS